MINLKKYIQILKVDILLGHIKITDDTVYVHYGIYTKLREVIGESTIDSFMHEITGKEYAGDFGMSMDDRYKWDSEEKLYSRRAYLQNTLTPGAG